MAEVKGGPAWLGLAGYVALYDYYACKRGHETMSGAFGRALSHKAVRWPTLLVTAMVMKHLLFPKVLTQADPLNMLAARWRGQEIIPHYNSSGEITAISISEFHRSIP